MNNKKPRILLYGQFSLSNYELTWLEWLKQNGYEVLPFNYVNFLNRVAPAYMIKSIAWHFLLGPTAEYISRHLVKHARKFSPDLLLVVNGNFITWKALLEIKNECQTTCFLYYGEDFFSPSSTKQVLRKAAPYYDWFFSSKSFNIPELARIGITNTSFLPFGYQPNCNYPVPISYDDIRTYGSDVAFVGTWEAERAEILTHLVEYDLRIWGWQWHKLPKKSPLRRNVNNKPVLGEEMSKVFNASKIDLSFLRKSNHDQHTIRTFEIPACGGFQLSERTDEILGFF